MRYDTDTALRELVSRGARIRLEKRRRTTKVLAAASLTCGALLLICLTTLVSATPVSTPLVAYGAYLLPGEAGGYVLAGVIAFAIGVAFATYYTRRRTNTFGNDQVKSNKSLVEGIKEDGSHV